MVRKGGKGPSPFGAMLVSGGCCLDSGHGCLESALGGIDLEHGHSSKVPKEISRRKKKSWTKATVSLAAERQKKRRRETGR